VQLGHPAFAEPAVGAVGVVGQPGLALGGDDDDDPMTLGCDLGQGPGDEQRLVVRVGMEGDQRERHGIRFRRLTLL
jgi:hypothetical protein